MKKIAGFVYDHSKLIIIMVIVLNLVSLASFFRFNLDADFLSFFSKGNPKADEYHALNEKYDAGESISILIESDGSLLEKDSLLNIYRLQQDVVEISGVATVQSFLPPEILAGTVPAPVDEAFINGQYETLKEFIDRQYFLTDQFLNEDRSSGIVIAALALDADTAAVIDTLTALSETGPVSFSLAGNPVIKETIWNYLLTILFILPPCAIILVLLVFFVILRNIRLTVLSIIPAGFAALWSFGTIFWSGQDLNLLSILSPMFILVMGSAYGLHYTSHFLDNLKKYKDRRELTVATMGMVGTPIFLATITTMAGFASLVWTDVVPMRHMGIFVTLGIGYAGIIALLFLPAVLSRLTIPEKAGVEKSKWINNFVLKASGRRLLVPLAFVIIVIVSAVAIPSLKVESNQLTFFKESSEIRRTFAQIEENFGSAIPLTGEIAAPGGQAALLNAAFANRVLETERAMEQLPGIKSAFSAFDVVVGINRMVTGQDVYPTNPLLLQGLLSQAGGTDLSALVSSDGIKMMVKTEELSSEDIERLESFVAENNDIIRVITGMPVLFSEMNKLVVRSQVQSLGLAMALIFIMLWITLRRITAALAGLLPIGITIIAIMGMLALTDFQLNLMTANLSAIAIGAGVDYSIHLLSGMYYYRGQGLNREDAVVQALKTVSRPVLANAFGLAIGFSALLFSPLRIHTQASVVMWVAMIVSSMAALLLVPQFYGRGKKSKTSQ
ncbi:MAG: efflux RND transporter permease subunit [Dehalococcoidales bacterium]|nr:efflux RND transporter permease subunit [Dehalococcoidales bacterium]